MKLIAYIIIMGLTVSCSRKNRAEEAEFNNQDDGVEIVIIRVKSNFSLPEFNRKIKVGSSEEGYTFHEMIPDTGGTVRVGLYQKSAGVFFLQDRISIYKIDTKARAIMEVDGYEGSLVGEFDTINGKWAFRRSSPEVE